MRRNAGQTPRRIEHAERLTRITVEENTVAKQAIGNPDGVRPEFAAYGRRDAVRVGLDIGAHLNLGFEILGESSRAGDGQC